MVLNTREKLRVDGSLNTVGNELEEFFMAAKIQDLRSYGCKFTWTNSHVSCKLDRAVGNEKFLQDLDSHARFDNAWISDHSPIVVTVGDKEKTCRGMLRYKDIWVVSFLLAACG